MPSESKKIKFTQQIAIKRKGRQSLGLLFSSSYFIVVVRNYEGWRDGWEALLGEPFRPHAMEEKPFQELRQRIKEA